MSLDERYKDDPELLTLYKENLLIPGWAGQLSLDELAYIREKLQRSPSLKRRWGFRPTAKRVSKQRIREVAMYGVQRRKK